LAVISCHAYPEALLWLLIDVHVFLVALTTSVGTDSFFVVGFECKVQSVMSDAYLA